VANLSSHKAGWDDQWEFFSQWAEKGENYKKLLLHLIDEDTNAFNRIIAAFRMPKGSEQEQQERMKAIEEATIYATRIPLQVMETACNSMEVMEAMIDKGLQSSLSDAGVGMLCARTAVLGAWYNVRINAKDIKDKILAGELLEKASGLAKQAMDRERASMQAIDNEI